MYLVYWCSSPLLAIYIYIYIYIYIQQYCLNLDFHFKAYMTMNKIQLSEY